MDSQSQPTNPDVLERGAQLGDFEVLDVLGQGAFGVVYLAREVSLDREVALKVTPSRGAEGRTMAQLEHQFIVQVFSEEDTHDGEQRLLCMQLVPGSTLQSVIRALSNGERAMNKSGNDLWVPGGSPVHRTWTGADLLSIIDRHAQHPASFDPSALHDRDALQAMGQGESVAWIGACLAEALDYAHQKSVIHRDIKPANILMNQYGQPLLADFNLSLRVADEVSQNEQTFGGTLRYMSPEHLRAFDPADPTPVEAVDERSDLFSLGVVLYELLEGESPFPKPNVNLTSRSEVVRQLEADKLQPTTRFVNAEPGPRQVLQRAIARCMEPEPGDRFSSGVELAEELNGCLRMFRVEEQLQMSKRFFRVAAMHPFVWLGGLAFFPHVIASVVNISYNNLQIIEQLGPPQKKLFMGLVLGYNAVVYPLTILAIIWLVRPVWKSWNKLTAGEKISEEDVGAGRRRALQLPIWASVLSAIGWLPGAVLFPVCLHKFAGPIDSSVFQHFIASFTLSGLIALAYSFCGLQLLVQRILYPRFWATAATFQENSAKELATTGWRLRAIQVLAGLIPLHAAILMLRLVPETGLQNLRWLITSLIVMGMFGFQIAWTVSRWLDRAKHVMTENKAR